MAKNLFITGGNGEIGSAVANAFDNYGFHVIAPSSSELDCSNYEAINQYFNHIELPAIDAFVHCAGINEPKPFLAITQQSLSHTLQVNTISFLHIIQQLDTKLINTSRIAAISSIYGKISRVNRLEYTTSKNGLKGMVQTLSLEMATRGILVNSISPGFIATKLTYKNNSQETISGLIADIPLKKLGEPAYVAELVYFLCSEKNQFITGQDIVIDGGYLTGGFQT